MQKKILRYFRLLVYASFVWTFLMILTLSTPRSQISFTIRNNIFRRFYLPNSENARQLACEMTMKQTLSGSTSINIAILIPTTTRRIQGPSLSNLSLIRLCIPSIIKTAEPIYNYSVYIGTEKGDYLETQFLTLKQFSTPNVNIIPSVVEGGTFTKVANAIAARAYTDGADYLVRVNDDTLIQTYNWTSLGICVLTSYLPQNVGVTGPTCHEGNTRILTHDMVHRTHLKIFGIYYPDELDNWWIDDWITHVYMPGRSTKLTGWVVKHVWVHDTRYEPNMTHGELISSLEARGKRQLEKFTGDVSNFPPMRVISYSLYGADPLYTQGAIANADLARIIYPDWTMRVYYDNSVPWSILKKLREKNVQLIDMSENLLKFQTLLWFIGLTSQNRMVWRFLVASDPYVERYIIRDIDSRLSWREKYAVDEWIASGKQFHVMRDHPSHSKYPISGGLWGGTRGALSDMDERLKKNRVSDGYLQDMDFLNREIWSVVNKSVLQHDAFSCDKYDGAVPFPTARVGWEHVGSVYVDSKMRQVDVDIIMKIKPPRQCEHMQ